MDKHFYETVFLNSYGLDVSIRESVRESVLTMVIGTVIFSASCVHETKFWIAESILFFDWKLQLVKSIFYVNNFFKLYVFNTVTETEPMFGVQATFKM